MDIERLLVDFYNGAHMLDVVAAWAYAVGNLKRINQLIEPGLDSGEVRQAAQEIHALAERCARALKGGDVSPAG
ncbi:hypothetical protein WME73_07725 [Sorangium sp. So ce302]|uniref:hypothetical protein n=1 Tax=unclassified Sorangium TaxID=2621164 RepID=UPI003F5FC5B0